MSDAVASTPASTGLWLDSHKAHLGSNHQISKKEEDVALDLLPQLPHRISLQPPPARSKGRGRDFWLVFIAVCSSSFLEALDFTTISTALPTITNQLKGSDKFTWVGASYTLASTVFQPLYGALADIFGRRSCMMAALSLFAIGSAICGAARNMEMLIVGRTIQGSGACGIGSLADIIIADLVPLKDRGTFTGILSAIWAVAAAIGPPIGGVFAERLSWRWLFYINLPLTIFSLLMVYFFSKLKIPSPEINVWRKLARIDWLGNLIIIVGATLTIIALTWGGLFYPWTSPQVLVTLILGLFLTGFFIYYEKRWAQDPSVPFALLSNPTGLSGYLGTFFHGIMATAVVYYLPLYFQAVKGHTPERAGIDVLEFSMLLSFSAIFSGISVAIFGRYLLQNYIGWVFSVIGFALLSLLEPQTVGFKLAILQIMLALGIGIVYGVVMFPIMAPLGVTENAHALAFFMFLRTFSYTFGIAIGGAVLQNSLTTTLSPSFLALFPPQTDIAYATTNLMRHLPAAQRQIVAQGFAKSLAIVWKVMAGIAGAGLLSCFLMREIPMSEELDENYALEERDRPPNDSAPSHLEGGRPFMMSTDQRRSESSRTLALVEPEETVASVEPGMTSLSSKSWK